MFNGFEYEAPVDSSRRNYNAAQQYCQDRGGKLASMTSAADNDYIAQFATREYNCYRGWVLAQCRI